MNENTVKPGIRRYLAKTCRKCFEEKEAKEFYQRIQNKDGLSSYCRKCFRTLIMDWRRKYPGRRSVHTRVAKALKEGMLKKPNQCEICSKETYLVGHHKDYRKPLVVSWICDSCHIKIHRKNGLRGGRPKKAVPPAVIETNPKENGFQG